MSNNSKFKEDLKNNANNLEDFFNICQKHFDCKNAKLGVITKNIMIINIDKIITLTKVKPK